MLPSSESLDSDPARHRYSAWLSVVNAPCGMDCDAGEEAVCVCLCRSLFKPQYLRRDHVGCRWKTLSILCSSSNAKEQNCCLAGNGIVSPLGLWDRSYFFLQQISKTNRSVEWEQTSELCSPIWSWDSVSNSCHSNTNGNECFSYSNVSACETLFPFGFGSLCSEKQN